MSGTTFDIEVIAAGGGPVFTYTDGTVIFHRGDLGDCAYIVKAGRIEIRKKRPRRRDYPDGRDFRRNGFD